jgi:peroxiredoxin
MAQLRHDYAKFKALHTEILVAVPNGPKMIEKYIRNHQNPYLILSDQGGNAAEQYSVQRRRSVPLTKIKIFTPSVFLVDRTGKIIYANYSTSYTSEPDNTQPLAILAGLT